MAKITRVTHQIFGLSGPANKFVQFGSTVTGTPVQTQDPTTIMALTAWGAGWQSAVIGGNRAPVMQEMNALEFVHSRQIGYLLQEGVPEWDSGTTYYQNSIVKLSGTYQLFASLVDSNIGNTPPAGTSNANWIWINPPPVAIAGMVEWCGAPRLPANYLPCDVSWSARTSYSRTTYADLFNAITIAATGTFSSGSAVVTGIVGGTTGMKAGMTLSGTAFATGTTIFSVDSGSQITMSATASTSATLAFVVLPHGCNDSSTFYVPCVSDFVRSVGTSRAVGSYQTDAMQGHKHANDASNQYVRTGTGLGGGSQNGAQNENTGSPVTDGTNGTPRTASETRPANTALIPVIRYAV